MPLIVISDALRLPLTYEIALNEISEVFEIVADIPRLLIWVLVDYNDKYCMLLLDVAEISNWIFEQITF